MSKGRVIINEHGKPEIVYYCKKWYVMTGQCGCDAILTSDPQLWPRYRIEFESCDFEEAKRISLQAVREANRTESQRIFEIDQNRNRGQ